MTWLAPLVLFVLVGCKSNHLVFLTYTKVGLDISATDGVPTEASFGYKRFEGAIIPVDMSVPAEGEEPAEAPAVYAALKAKNSWVNGLDIYQVFATGQAALDVSGDGGRYLSAVLKGLEDEGEQDSEEKAPDEGLEEANTGGTNQ